MSIRLLYSSLRSARHCLPQAPVFHRSFSVTRQRQAQEDANPHHLQERIQSTELFKKLAASPAAFQAINEFRQVLEKEGMSLAAIASSIFLLLSARLQPDQKTKRYANDETGVQPGNKGSRPPTQGSIG
jgi:hypothetical protein